MSTVRHAVEPDVAPLTETRNTLAGVIERIEVVTDGQGSERLDEHLAAQEREDDE